MKRLLVNGLALIGALTVTALLAGAALRQLTGPNHVVVTGADSRPLPSVPVFLDRGSMAIERYVSDSNGAVEFPLRAQELERSVWLICAPGGIPMVGRRERSQAGPTTYGYTPLPDSTWGWYRANGWRGPIPRECPRGTDSLGWRYPPSSGKSKDAITYSEPIWPR
jgi:hypothetical protein